jgi:hypothetical protein
MIALRHATLQGGLILGLIIFEQASPPIARAGSVFFEFSDSINGTAPSSNPGGGSPPWLTAKITDIEDGGGVQIEFTSNLQGNEFIDNVGFNLDDTLFSKKRLTIDCIAGACANFSSQYSKNAFSVVSGGASPGGKVSGFDIGFLFGNNQLKGGSMATIQLLAADLGRLWKTKPIRAKIPV